MLVGECVLFRLRVQKCGIYFKALCIQARKTMAKELLQTLHIYVKTKDVRAPTVWHENAKRTKIAVEYEHRLKSRRNIVRASRWKSRYAVRIICD